jgi:hypothetical protein
MSYKPARSPPRALNAKQGVSEKAERRSEQNNRLMAPTKVGMGPNIATLAAANARSGEMLLPSRAT